jgi:hypothetical protein
VLTLLSDPGRPVLCLAGVLAFVVRRLRDEPIMVQRADRTAAGRGPG